MAEYYIGQLFIGSYPPDAAIWCNQNNAHIEKQPGKQRKYKIVANPEPPAPTIEDVDKQRIEYRHEHIDDKTLARMRKQANGTWTQEDEEAYLELDREVTAYIEEHFPYPVEA